MITPAEDDRPSLSRREMELCLAALNDWHMVDMQANPCKPTEAEFTMLTLKLVSELSNDRELPLDE